MEALKTTTYKTKKGLIKTVELSGDVLSLSGGRTSGFMTIKELERDNSDNRVVIFCNTGKEHELTLFFVHQLDQYIQSNFGKEIIWLEYNPDNENGFDIVTYETASREGEPFAKLIQKTNLVPNRIARFCSQELKVRIIKYFCQKVLGWKYWSNYVGIRYDEPRRWSKKTAERKEVFDIVHCLVPARVTKKTIMDYWGKMRLNFEIEGFPFDLQILEHEGNCDICFLKGTKKKQKIARTTPEKFVWWIDQEKRTGCSFSKEYTYEQLLDFVLRSPEFGFDDSIECMCNID